MQAKPLPQNGTIGICSPSHVAVHERYDPILAGMKKEGFRVAEAENLYKDTWGYLASDTERAADLNQLAADEGVDYILFGGGEGSPELLPYLDFDLFKKNPKRVCSYSDGTTLLNTIWANTGLETYYGQDPAMFTGWTDYNRRHFEGHILSDNMREHEKNSPWRVITPGVGEGVLCGGYTMNFALLLGSQYFPVDGSEPHILFLEDHEKYNGPANVSSMLGCIEQSSFMKSVTGLIFGNYSDGPCLELYARLKVLGERQHIPVIYCDDFGHGANHAILPIGRKARLGADGLRYL